MKALIDSDIIVYRVGSVTNDDALPQALSKVDAFLNNLLLFDLPDVFEYELHLTGKNNFRFKKAVTLPYKGNRKKSSKPTHYKEIRQHLIKKWSATLWDEIEADDALAIRQHELTEEFSRPDESVIVTLDKDLDMVEGWHYNFVKKNMYKTTHEEGDFKFHMQFLTGDRVDNIQGVHGIGEKKAFKLLDGKTATERWDIIKEMLGEDRAIENGYLLYMLRSHDDNFEKYLERSGLA